MGATEQYTSFTVNITLPNGDVMTVPQMARTRFEAVDKAYTKYSDKQSLRHMYQVRNPFINLNTKRK